MTEERVYRFGRMKVTFLWEGSPDEDPPLSENIPRWLDEIGYGLFDLEKRLTKLQEGTTQPLATVPEVLLAVRGVRSTVGTIGLAIEDVYKYQDRSASNLKQLDALESWAYEAKGFLQTITQRKGRKVRTQDDGMASWLLRRLREIEKGDSSD